MNFLESGKGKPLDDSRIAIFPPHSFPWKHLSVPRQSKTIHFRKLPSFFEEDDRKKRARRGGNQFPCGGFSFLTRQMVFPARFIISRDAYDTEYLETKCPQGERTRVGYNGIIPTDCHIHASFFSSRWWLRRKWKVNKQTKRFWRKREDRTGGCSSFYRIRAYQLLEPHSIRAKLIPKSSLHTYW